MLVCKKKPFQNCATFLLLLYVSIYLCIAALLDYASFILACLLHDLLGLTAVIFHVFIMKNIKSSLFASLCHALFILSPLING